jgi:hypothetical protein
MVVRMPKTNFEISPEAIAAILKYLAKPDLIATGIKVIADGAKKTKIAITVKNIGFVKCAPSNLADKYVEVSAMVSPQKITVPITLPVLISRLTKTLDVGGSTTITSLNSIDRPKSEVLAFKGSWTVSVDPLDRLNELASGEGKKNNAFVFPNV